MSQEPLSPAGFLVGLDLIFEGVTTTGGPFAELMADPKHKRAWLRQCRVPRCQRPRNHGGEHYRRCRWPRRFWAWADDAPFKGKQDKPGG